MVLWVQVALRHGQTLLGCKVCGYVCDAVHVLLFVHMQPALTACRDAQRGNCHSTLLRRTWFSTIFWGARSVYGESVSEAAAAAEADPSSRNSTSACGKGERKPHQAAAQLAPVNRAASVLHH